MRAVIGAHEDFYTGDDTLAHWKFGAASNFNETDSSGNGYTLIDVNNVPAVDSLKGPNPGGKGAKDLDGAADHYTNAGGASARSAHIADNLTVELFLEPDSLHDGVPYYFGGDPTSGSSAENIGLKIFLRTTGAIQVRWEHGSGTSVTLDSTITYDATQPHYIGVVRKTAVSGTAGKVDLHLYIWAWDGTYQKESWTDQDDPDGGTNATWTIGRNGTATDYYNGSIDEIIVSSFAKTEDGIRDSFKRLRIDWSQSQLYANNEYATDLRFLVEDDSGEFQDLTDLFGYNFFNGASWGADIDDQGATANVQLAREIYNYQLAPLVASGAVADTYDLLQLARKCKIQTAVLPLDYGTVPEWAWDLVFEGTISAIHWASNPVRVFCRGREAGLINNYISTSLLTSAPRGAPGGTAVETEMQSMIDDYEPENVGTGYGTYIGEDGPPQIYTPTSPGWNVREWNQENMSTYEACTRLADMIAWSFRFRWDDNRAQFRLTFEEPDRSPVSTDYTFGVGSYFEPDNLVLDESEIRNYGVVYYGNRSSTDSIGDYDRANVSYADATSISKYGFRPFEISEATHNGLIDQSTEATTLVQGAVQDLAEPKASLSIPMPYRHFVQLRDYYTFSANDIHFDADTDLAVSSYQHQADADGKIRTRLNLRGKPAGRGPAYIGQQFAMPGIAPVRNPDGPATPSAPTLVSRAGRGLVSWDPPVNNLNRRHDWTEVHVSTSSGFTPSSSTLQGLVRGTQFEMSGLDPADTYYVKIIHRDRIGRGASQSAASAQTSFTPQISSLARITKNGTATTQTSYTQVTGWTEVFDNGNDFATNQYTAPDNGYVDVRAQVFFRSASVTWGQIAIYKNGALYAEGTQAIHSSINTKVLVASGDTLDIYHKASASVAGALLTTGSWAEFEFVS